AGALVRSKGKHSLCERAGPRCPRRSRLRRAGVVSVCRIRIMARVRRRFIALVVLAVVLLGSTAVAQVRPLVPPPPAALAEALAALTTAEMEGRRPGTAGGARAAAQVADWLRAAGLQPAGDAGSFFQSFVL